MTSLSEVELSKTEPDRPLYPPKLISVQILDNPFDDIVPRITKEEKKAQQKAKRQAMENREKERDRKKVKKNVGLLSFGEAEEVEVGKEKRGGISSHDLLKDDKRLKNESIAGRERETFEKEERRESETKENGKGKEKEKEKKKSKEKEKESGDLDLSSIRTSHSKSTQSDSASKIQSLEDSIRGLSSSNQNIEEKKEVEKKVNKGRELLEQARLHYSNNNASSSSKSSSTSGKKKESEALKALEKFQNSLREGKKEKESSSNGKGKERKWLEVEDEEIPPEDREYGAGDDDDDDWRSHR